MMALQVKTLSYVGTDIEHDITGVGFTPSLAWTHSPENYDNLVWTHPGIQPNQTLYVGQADIEPYGFVNLNSGGFRVSDVPAPGPTAVEFYVNDSPYTYFAACFAGSDVATGTYVGDGAADRDIVGLGFKPGAVFVKRHVSAPIPNNNVIGVIRLKDMPVDESHGINDGAGSILSTAIRDFVADGFKIGDHQRVNRAGDTYSYWAFTETSDSIRYGEYTGNDTADREIVAGMQPVIVIVAPKRTATVCDQPGYRYDVMPEGLSESIDGSGIYSLYYWGDTNANYGIRAFTSQGFKVGIPAGGGFTAGDLFNRSSYVEYYWVAIGNGARRAYSIVY